MGSTGSEMSFDQMGRDVEMGRITCCDERAPRTASGHKETLARGPGARRFPRKPGGGMWQGPDPASMRGDSEGQVSSADLSWAVGRTRAKSPTAADKS